jgi:hypothetical protein
MAACSQDIGFTALPKIWQSGDLAIGQSGGTGPPRLVFPYCGFQVTGTRGAGILIRSNVSLARGREGKKGFG